MNLKYRKTLAAVTAMATMVTATACPMVALASETAAVTKEETVYVVTDASGKTDDVIVSDHLVNTDGAAKLEDSSSLKDIRNVKGDEKFTQKGKSLVWDAAGQDIYYQGRTEETLPVKVSVKYYMEGESFTGKEIQGKKGDFRIDMSFSSENSVPFMVLSGIMVKNDNYSNMSVSSGKVLDDGEKTIVAGMAAPGLTDRLKGKALTAAEDAGFGNEITITGHTNSFDVTDIMSVATNGIFDNIDTDEFAGLDYDDQIDRLNKGSKQLVDGTQKLYEGLEQMYDKAPELSDGVKKLDDGAAKLNSGMKVLSSNANALAQGQAGLQQGILKLYTGIKGNGTAEAPGIKAGIGQLSAGIDKLTEGAVQLSNGLDSLINGVDQLISVSNGYLDTAVSNGAEAASKADKVAQDLAANKDAIVDAIGEDAYNQLAANAADAAAKAGNAATAAGTAKYLNSNDDSDKPDIRSTVGGAVTSLKAGINGDGTAVNPGIKGGAAAIKSGLNTLDGGVDTIIDGFEKEDGLLDGAAKLTNGSAALFKGIGNTGSQSADTLVGGAAQLASGMDELNSKTGTLVKGIEKLFSGSNELADGMSELYKEGISRIVKLYDEEIKGLADSVEDTVAAAQSYDNFSGKKSEMTGNVKFVFKTEIK